MNLLFLCRSIDRPNFTRPLILASCLAARHKCTLAGPIIRTEMPYQKPKSKNIALIPIKSKNLLVRIYTAIKISKNSDIIIASDPSFYSCAAATILKLFGKKFIFDTGDEKVNFSFEFKRKVKHFRLSILPELVQHLYGALAETITFFLRHFADAITVSSPMLQKKYGGSVLPAPVDLVTIKSANKASVQAIRQKFPGKLIVYTGTIQIFKGLDDLVDAFPLIKNKSPNAKLLLVGFPGVDSFAAWLKHKSSTISSDIIFLGHMPYEKLVQYMLAADCLVLPNPDNIVHRFQLPTKLFNYMCSGRPLVATVVGGTPKILLNGQCGLLAKPDDSADLADKIIKTLKNKNLAKQLANSAYSECTKKYTFEICLPKIEKLFLISS